MALGMCRSCYSKYRWQKANAIEKATSHLCEECKIETQSKYMEPTVAPGGVTEWFCKWCLSGEVRGKLQNVCEKCGRLHRGTKAVCVDCILKERAKKYSEAYLRLE